MKKEAGIINQACKMAFFVGFEKYKAIAQTYLPTDVIKLLQTDCIDERLLAIVVDSMKKFARMAYYSIEPNKVHAAV